MARSRITMTVAEFSANCDAQERRRLAGKAQAMRTAQAARDARLTAAKAADEQRRMRAANAVLLAQVGGRRVNAAAPSDMKAKDAKRLFSAAYPTLTQQQQQRLDVAVGNAFAALQPEPETVDDALQKIRDQVSGKKAPSTVAMFDAIADAVDDEAALAKLTWDLSVARDYAETGAAIDGLVAFLETFAEAA